MGPDGGGDAAGRKRKKAKVRGKKGAAARTPVAAAVDEADVDAAVEAEPPQLGEPPPPFSPPLLPASPRRQPSARPDLRPSKKILLPPTDVGHLNILIYRGNGMGFPVVPSVPAKGCESRDAGACGANIMLLPSQALRS